MRGGRGWGVGRGGGRVVLLRKTQVEGESFWLIEFRLHGNYEFVRIALSTSRDIYRPQNSIVPTRYPFSESFPNRILPSGHILRLHEHPSRIITKRGTPVHRPSLKSCHNYCREDSTQNSRYTKSSISRENVGRYIRHQVN